MATETDSDENASQLHRRRLGRRRGRETLEDRNPATGELTALVPLSGAADIDAAARAARDAQPAWRRSRRRSARAL